MTGGDGKLPANVAYLWDGNLLSGERRIYADGTESSVEYHYEQDSFAPMAQVVDGELNYIVTDQIGTPREMFSEQGKLTWGRRQKLWGQTEELLHLKASNDNAGYQDCLIRFQGQIEDQESGLYYNYHRYYNVASQYISSDPIRIIGGVRLNGYVHNPNRWIDPFGLAELSHAENFDAAMKDAFEKAGMTDPNKIEFSKCDPVTGTVVEFKGQGGAKVAYDAPHADMDALQGHDKPHVGWQSEGKRKNGGASRGNITYDGPQHPHRSNKKC